MKCEIFKYLLANRHLQFHWQMKYKVFKYLLANWHLSISEQNQKNILIACIKSQNMKDNKHEYLEL